MNVFRSTRGLKVSLLARRKIGGKSKGRRLPCNSIGPSQSIQQLVSKRDLGSPCCLNLEDDRLRPLSGLTHRRRDCRRLHRRPASRVTRCVPTHSLPWSTRRFARSSLVNNARRKTPAINDDL